MMVTRRDEFLNAQRLEIAEYNYRPLRPQSQEHSEDKRLEADTGFAIVKRLIHFVQRSCQEERSGPTIF